MVTDAQDWPATTNGAGPSTMKRGRRQNNNLPPSRSREIQRAFRQRRADYIAGELTTSTSSSSAPLTPVVAGLEQRIRDLEGEADELRSRLREPPRYDIGAEIHPDGPQPLRGANDSKSRGRAKAYLTQLGFQLRASDSSRGRGAAGKAAVLDEGSDDDEATPSPLSPSTESLTRPNAADSSPHSASAPHHGYFGSPAYSTFPTPPMHQPSPGMTYTSIPPPPAPAQATPPVALGSLPPQDPAFTAPPYHHGYPVPMGWRPAPVVGQPFATQTMSTPAIPVTAYDTQYVDAHQYPIPHPPR